MLLSYHFGCAFKEIRVWYDNRKKKKNLKSKSKFKKHKKCSALSIDHLYQISKQATIEPSSGPSARLQKDLMNSPFHSMIKIDQNQNRSWWHHLLLLISSRFWASPPTATSYHVTHTSKKLNKRRTRVSIYRESRHQLLNTIKYYYYQSLTCITTSVKIVENK